MNDMVLTPSVLGLFTVVVGFLLIVIFAFFKLFLDRCRHVESQFDRMVVIMERYGDTFEKQAQRLDRIEFYLKMEKEGS